MAVVFAPTGIYSEVMQYKIVKAIEKDWYYLDIIDDFGAIFQYQDRELYPLLEIIQNYDDGGQSK
jgi:hypothetical protein